MGKFITFILKLSIFLVFLVTVYFSLDFFEIIEVPKKYSLVEILDSKVDIVSSVQEYVQLTLQDKSLEDIYNTIKQKESIVVELEGNPVTTIYLENAEETVGEEPQNTYKEFKYYDQLNGYAKKIYDSLEKDKEELKTGNYTFNFGNEFNDLLNQDGGEKILNDSFQLAVNGFLFDHPEIFYVDITKMYLLTEITTRPFSKTYKVSIGANGKNYLYDQYRSVADVENAIQEVEQVREDILQGATGNEYEKIKYIHDYIVNSSEYEQTEKSHNNYTIYGNLVNKKSVCEGYAKSFKYILDRLNIPCIMVFGIAQNSAGKTESHAWNYVFLNENWYAIDVTWDDPVIIGSGYVTHSQKYKYFLKGSKDFFKDHIEDGTVVEAGTFSYPKLNENDYR